MDKEKVQLWNGAIEYLKKSRYSWWNEDYIIHLIEKVWKIDKPVSIIDFGCGIGFVGELLLPLLPESSTYTGVDIGDKLLEEAKLRFEKTNYKTEFIHADLCEFSPEAKYDIAICQAVLQHIPNPKLIIEKMKNSVKQNGLVIAMDVSRDMCSSALYIDGFDYSKTNLLGIEQKLRHNILTSSNKDFEIGLKVPVYMRELGLKNIDIRLNDYVQYINPDDSDYQEKYDAYVTGNGRLTEDKKESFIQNYISKGLTFDEAEKLFVGQKEKIDYIYENSKNLSVVRSMSMLISYGYVIK